MKKTLRNWVKKIPLSAFLAVPCVLLFCALIALISFRIKAQATGSMAGARAGQLAGRAIGSLQGVTIGQLEGYKAGKEEGLSAKDTTAELSGKIQEVEKLQVLVASGTFSDVLTINEKRGDYAVLLSTKYNAVYTVDLSSAEIDLKENVLHILLSQPEVEFSPIGDIEKKGEYQRDALLHKVGSAEGGYVATLNSINQIQSKAKEQFINDESMQKAARASAETQLKQLVNAASLSKLEVLVEFREK